jgi:6-phosphogluconolactonase (cycloisomerase 2 family)
MTGQPFTANLAPEDVKVTPNGAFALVSNTNSGTLQSFSINATTGALTPVSTVSLPGAGTFADDIAIDATSHFVYVADNNNSQIDIFDLSSAGVLTADATPSVAAQTPDSLVATSNGFLYACNNNTPGSVFAFKLVNGIPNAITGSPFVTGGNVTFDMAADPAGQFLYVPNSGSGTVSEFTITQSGASAGALTLLGSVLSGSGAGSGASAVAVDATGKFAIVTNESDDTVSVFSIGSGGALTVVGTPVNTDVGPSDVVATNAGFVYVSNGSATDVSAFSLGGTGTLTPVLGSPFSIGTNPGDLGVNPNGSFLYVTEPSAGAVGGFQIH